MGLEVTCVTSVEELSERLPQAAACVALLDTRRIDASIEACMQRLRESASEAEIVALAQDADVAAAVEWMRAGAYDYVVRSAGPERLRAVARDALQRSVRRSSAHGALDQPDPPGVLDQIVARSASMRRLVGTVRDLAPSDANVLIEAESGTGKELIAGAIHETSPRAVGPFVPVDCGALPEGIVEGELFGHARGAFTGADRPQLGLFRAAQGGTLFLDEVGELPLLTQAKLLRVIQQREVRPLGTSVAVPIDVRLVAATNRDLASEVRAGRFRPDLFFRLRVVALSIPPLRARPEDIPVLAGRFLARATRGGRVSGFEPEVLDRLISHRWEGNVRELENTIEAAAALSRGPRITIGDLQLVGAARTSAAPHTGIPLALDAYEAACLREALRCSGGDVTRAARVLGIGRSTLYRKLARHGLCR
jgi:DNA-binding NtrC family response regulator